MNCLLSALPLATHTGYEKEWRKRGRLIFYSLYKTNVILYLIGVFSFVFVIEEKM